MMKGITLIFLILFSNLIGLSQDTLILKDRTSLITKIIVIEEGIVKYKRFDNLDGPLYSVHSNDVHKIKYFNGNVKVFNELIEVSKVLIVVPPTNSEYTAKNIFKFKLTSVLACKIGFAYERVIKQKYSWEFEPSLIFPNPIYDAVTQFFWPNVWFKNQGFEIRTGLNILKIRKDNERLMSSAHGLFITYRYTHNSHVRYWTGGISGSSYNTLYTISQTKNLVGLIYKWSFFNAKKKVSMEPFYELGFYCGFARTVCFRYSVYGTSASPMGVYNVGLPYDNGYVFIPVVRIGVAIRGRDHNKK